MDSHVGRKAEFTRDLAARLDGTDPGVLADRTGLLEATVRTMLSGDGELMSWEVVSACLAAAGVDGVEVGELRGRWAAAENALWEEWGGELHAAFERNGHGKPSKAVEAYREKVPWRQLTERYPVTFKPWTEPAFAADRRLPDPSTAGDIRDFYAFLAKLREWAGAPRQTEIEKRSWGTLPDATISAMLQKDRWRSTSDRERARIGHFARACGLPAAEVARWDEAYERLRHVPPTDDLARARAEAAELRRRLAAAQAEADELRERLSETERSGEHPAGAEEPREHPAEASGPRERPAEADGLRERPAGEEELSERPAVGGRRDAEREPGPETEGRPRRRWPSRRRRSLSAAAAMLVFAAGAGAGRLAGGGTSAADRPECFSGTLHLVGSTAFERTADILRQGYEARCRDARIEVSAIGSNEGVRALTADNAASTIAMHDGYLESDSDEIRLRGFRGYPVALVAFAVIANKDTGVTGLSLRDLRSIYAPDGPTSWKSIKGGGDLPIRLVSRTEGSGTRGIFEEHVLRGPEPDLSSSDCRRKDDLRASMHVIRCERSTQGQVLDTVDTVPGTIGYAEVHVASDARRYPNVRMLALDGRMPTASPTMDRYPFVAPEIFYTDGPPPNGSSAAAFLTFLTGDDARRLLRQAGAPVCVGPGSLISAPCQPD
ncbi:substrate-binding domain-containing protein [Actinoallomurus rhizosphaericola]|uniref:substrate-binding domain-containing protein n=1 Tax=Actinoallomurus rhizosphaericola TaxID=2952536 RepID=UPI00209029DD|nr:substrate-binding domain-containing protein [Actinoallomurus rhizosphaericola]MCO5994336.1 substrate-binding domain-containing protein [Actinoallomurus rhizosphaericola]